MGWLRLVGCLKIYVSLQNIGLFCRSLLQKRPILLSILLIVATPYEGKIDNGMLFFDNGMLFFDSGVRSIWVSIQNPVDWAIFHLRPIWLGNFPWHSNSATARSLKKLDLKWSSECISDSWMGITGPFSNGLFEKNMNFEYSGFRWEFWWYGGDHYGVVSRWLRLAGSFKL